jgi:hypothetical protein
LAIHCGVDVEHGHVAKELGIVLQSVLIVSLNQLFSNLFFDHLLGFLVIGVCISKSDLSLLLGLLLIHDFFQTICDYFLKFAFIFRVQGLCQALVLALEPGLEVLVCEPHFFDFADFLADAHSLRIVDHLVGQLLLSESGTLTGTAALSEEVV